MKQMFWRKCLIIFFLLNVYLISINTPTFQLTTIFRVQKLQYDHIPAFFILSPWRKLKVTFYLSCNRKLHMNLTSFMLYIHPCSINSIKYINVSASSFLQGDRMKKAGMWSYCNFCTLNMVVNWNAIIMKI
jgi:hypothetical protein